MSRMIWPYKPLERTQNSLSFHKVSLKLPVGVITNLSMIGYMSKRVGYPGNESI